VSRLARIVLVVAVLVLGAPGLAAARSEKTIDYQAAKVWPTAVRFLRVDEGVRIIEKDADAGYVMFELDDEGKVFTGALELVVADDEQGPRVRMVIRIEDRPSYVEVAMLERLERKVRADLGSAPARKPAETKKPDKPAKPDESPDDKPPADKPKDDDDKP
jgi:hypothetical protein